MGKYDAILRALSLKRLEEEPKNQEKVNVIKDAMRTEFGADLTGVKLAELYLEARDEKNALNAQLSEVNKRLTALEQLIDDSQERGAPGWGDYGTSESTVRLITGTMINVQREPFAQVVDRDANRLWAVKTGLERSLALPWSTLNSHTKELLILGEPLPAGVKLWVRTTIRLTRGDGGGGDDS